MRNRVNIQCCENLNFKAHENHRTIIIIIYFFFIEQKFIFICSTIGKWSIEQYEWDVGVSCVERMVCGLTR